MVKIRLTRTGRKNHATYRLVAIDSRKARDSKALEFLGYYLPHDKQITLETERINYWLSVGAQPSDTVTRLLVKEGVLGKEALPTKKYAVKAGKKASDRAEKAEEAKEAPAEVKEEAVAEEAEAKVEDAQADTTEEIVEETKEKEAE